MRDGARHHDGEDDALDPVKLGMAYGFRLLGERHEGAGRFEEAHEPSQPQERPAVKPLETKIGNVRRQSACSDTRAKRHARRQRCNRCARGHHPQLLSR